MIQFGIRAHDYCGPGTVEEVVDQLYEGGIRHIQLAMSKSFSAPDFSGGHYSPGLAHYIGEQLAKRNIHVAVLGCYINPVIPDENLRLAEVNRFIEHLKYAKSIGADMVGTETGRYSLDMSVTPETQSEACYKLLLDSFRRIVKAAEQIGVTVGVEGVFDHTLSTPEKMDRFLRDLDSHMVEVILDNANLIAPWTISKEQQEAITEEAFALYGNRISVLHLKDCVFQNGVQQCTRPGEGLICYERLMRHIKAEKPYIIGLLEESSPAHFKADCDFFHQQIGG